MLLILGARSQPRSQYFGVFTDCESLINRVTCVSLCTQSRYTTGNHAWHRRILGKLWADNT